MTWAPSRQAALAQLSVFIPEMGEAYARTRNFDLGPGARASVSGLSPWLRSRLLAPEEVLEAESGFAVGWVEDDGDGDVFHAAEVADFPAFDPDEDDADEGGGSDGGEGEA
jgi:hypothetical protein